ncbi:hypothetical protein BP5796_05733 [Coleophoma crateriformis]|uniref:Zn(2)-C6 fungal-type domain-containing protein n=1 Tax=Coleophoma crateriformis TaxID=565419 RepID=A0A3D8RVP8_9HELO|nr:hypothetical protein BP5796_05733 [Coleophoma crateriformis]
MAAIGGSSRSHATQVCTTCKTRKKKCDKVLPSCGYCVGKGLGCGYDESQPRHHEIALSASHTSGFTTIPSDPTVSEVKLYLQVHQLIRATGRFVDDVTAQYFQGLHRYLPVISRTRFHSSLVTLGTTPSAGFSVLLLSICLITSSSKPGWHAGYANNTTSHVDGRTLHRATKSLFAQVQGFCPPSVHLIQAALLLAVYEYTHGRPEEAFVSLAGCARMAYAAGIHRPSPAVHTDTDTNVDLRLQLEEAANTWWGIIIYERVFYCEVSVSDQPLITVFPSGDARLPTEPSVLEQSDVLSPEQVRYIPVSYLSSVDVGGFGRSVQAAWLLDQVLKGREIASLESRSIQLRDLDTALQAFLGEMMQQCSGKRGLHCEAVAITLRAMFTLHWHILSQSQQVVTDKHRSLEDWCTYSRAALDTATKMVLDIAETHETLDRYQCVCLTPSHSYMIRAALKHIYESGEWQDVSWLQSAEKRLRACLD